MARTKTKVEHPVMKHKEFVYWMDVGLKLVSVVHEIQGFNVAFVLPNNMQYDVFGKVHYRAYLPECAINTIKSFYDGGKKILKNNCNIDLDNCTIRSTQKIHLPDTNKELYENDNLVKVNDNLKYDINLYFEIEENN